MWIIKMHGMYIELMMIIFPYTVQCCATNTRKLNRESDEIVVQIILIYIKIYRSKQRKIIF